MTCGEEKSILEFYFRDKKTGRRHSACKECDKARVKARHQANPERTRNNDLKRNYGITLEEHTKMYEEQNGRCAICGNEGNGKWKKLCVDHCHTTGKLQHRTGAGRRQHPHPPKYDRIPKYKLVGINFCFLIVLIYTQIIYIVVELESRVKF
jgi:hypothetical protein